jgi:hypothetical protein
MDAPTLRNSLTSIKDVLRLCQVASPSHRPAPPQSHTQHDASYKSKVPVAF